MIHNDRVYIGFDLSYDYAQISYCLHHEQSVETCPVVAGEEQYQIPFCMFKRKGINQWFVGKEVEYFKEKEEGTLLKNLFSLALEKEKIFIEDEEFETVAMLALFIKRTLAMQTMCYRMEQLAGITFTVPVLNEKTLALLQKTELLMNLKGVEIFFQGREESIFKYMNHQSMELKKEQVTVFDGNAKSLDCFVLNRNEHTVPVVVLSSGYHYDKLEEDEEKKDNAFLDIIQERQIPVFSAVFLIGNQFKGDWCQKSLQELCRNRRVFKGNNLYSKGACYTTIDRMNAGAKTVDHSIFLGKDKLKTNVGMQVKRGEEDSYLAILNGGENWYECKKEFQIILSEGNSLHFIVTPLDGRNIQNIEVVLDGLKVRPKNMTRLKITAAMSNENIMQLEIEDMGFGEFYPASGMKFREQINLSEEGK